VNTQVSEEFLGTSYNLLTFNCNHFTSHLCYALTSCHAPKWLNRAASIGLALPCVVPQEWIAPPDADTADGELLDDADEYRDDERTMMLRNTKDRRGSRHSFGEESLVDGGER
jgi:deubiquitinase DESI2